jgi:hypothetical protein
MDRDNLIFMLKSTTSGHVITTDTVRMSCLANALPKVHRLFFYWVLIAPMGVKDEMMFVSGYH